MAETPRSTVYCLNCGAENERDAGLCRGCAESLALSEGQRREGAAFLLNELEKLRAEGAMGEATYAFLQRRYLAVLRGEEEPAPAAPRRAPAAATPAPTVAAEASPVVAPTARAREGPDWLAEQQANLLLYLGAFLIVIATLVFVSASGEAVGGGVRMVLLTIGTLLFLVTGILCQRFPRVQQAGIVFFGVGALMVPLNFVGAYAFFFAEDDIDPAGLWLAGSLTSALFYGAASFSGLSRWYPVPAAVAMLSALAAVLHLAQAPAEAYPGSYVALALLFVAPSTLRLGRVSEVFAPVCGLTAHVMVPFAAIVAVYIAAVASGQSGEEVLELMTRWYLPPTLGLAAAFYWGTAIAPPRPAVLPREADGVFTIAALVVIGGAGVSILFGLDAGPQWYGVAIAAVGWIYAAGSPGFGPRWFGQQYLGWLALVTITVSWLLLEGLYVDHPRIGAGVHFSGALFYLAAARVVAGEIDLFPLEASRAEDSSDTEPTMLTVPAAAAFIYATGLTVAIGYYHLLASLPAAEGAEASDLGLPFFYLSLGVIAVAVAMRWLWPEMRLHGYAVAIGLSLFVLLSSVEEEGRVTLLLAIYGGLAFAIALWELEALALVLPAAYGFFALLAAWRRYEPHDAYLPLIIALIAWTLYATHAALREQEQEGRWAGVLLSLAFVYAALAPVVGWIRLSQLADTEGFVGTRSFEETLLYQTSAATVALLGLLVAAQAWVKRWPDLAIGASALLMVALLLEIGHFRPENVQAYTAPLGAYLLTGALLGLRVRELPEDLRSLLGPLEAIGAGLIMGPSLMQSFDEGAWRSGMIVLAEGLIFVSLALVQRRVWLLGVSVGFVVLDGIHYLVFSGGPAIPTWAILAMAGIAVMGAGTAILLGRDRWTEWQQAVIAWWNREPLPASVE